MMLRRLITWWQKPPARERILAQLSTTEWRRGIDIIKAADVHVGQFYIVASELEDEDVIETKWEEGPPKAKRGYRPHKLFRLKLRGQRRRVYDTASRSFDHIAVAPG